MAREPTRSNALTETANRSNLITIVGTGVPANYEVTVDGEIDLVDPTTDRASTVISGSSVEGTIDSDVHRFEFSGEMSNVHLVDWNGVDAATSPVTPTVHVTYDSPR